MRALLLTLLLSTPALAGERVACAEDYPRGPGEHRWAYREVDGRACWYRGRHKPVRELYWSVPNPPSAVEPVERQPTFNERWWK